MEAPDPQVFVGNSHISLVASCDILFPFSSYLNPGMLFFLPNSALNIATIYSPTCLLCSLVFMMLFFSLLFSIVRGNDTRVMSCAGF